MFLGCQKIDYHAKHCNIDPKEKVFRKTLPSLERPVSVIAERELITQNCEWKKKKKKIKLTAPRIDANIESPGTINHVCCETKENWIAKCPGAAGFMCFTSRTRNARTRIGPIRMKSVI